MRLTRALAFFVLLTASAARGFAADAASAITGLAVDTQGLALPGVTVTLSRAGSEGDAQMQVTDGDGRFTFDALAPGAYTIVFSLSGFEDKKFDAVAVPASGELKAVMGIAGFSETVTVRPESTTEPIPSTPAGEAVIEQKVLADVPLASDRFEDALPLLPGVVRGPDGLLNMNGARADQSAVLMNGINMADPVTGHSAVRLPLEAIDALNVHAGVYPTSIGSATGGITDIVIRPGQDKVDFQIQNLMPRFRFHNGIEGFDSFTPRLRVSGPIQQGRLWYSEAISYRFVRTPVNELAPRGEDEQKVHSFDAVTQIDAALDGRNHMTATLLVFPSNVDNAGIDTLHLYDATPDIKQRGWTGAVSDHIVLADNTTLAVAAAFKEYDMNVAPKHESRSVVGVSGMRENYFNRFDRDSWRYDANATIAIAQPSAWGPHLVRGGGQYARTSYSGTDAGLPVDITGANGSRLAHVDYLGTSAVGATNTELGGFLEDEWAIASQITLHGGVRYGYNQMAGEQTLAPRGDITYRPFSHGRTVIKAGAGRFYDNLPLNAADFSQQQSRQITYFDAAGNVNAVSLVTNRTAAGGIETPASTAYNAEIDQFFAGGWLARAGYRHTDGSHQLVVDPAADQHTLLLSSRGTSQADEFEITVRRQFKNGGQLTGSYVRSSTKGDLNNFVSLFGDVRDPIIRANEYAPQAFDVPNRFLVWGIVNAPYGLTVAPTMEYRTGFPYTIVDDRQQTVGSRNDERFPNLFTLDLAVTKDVQLSKSRRARVGVQFFNLTNHFNPQDVQNNTSSPTFGSFANSVDRQIRTKFTFLF